MKIHNFSICDFVRREDNGKFILIGLYSNEIIFPSFPVRFHFTMWLLAEHEALGIDDIQIRVRTSLNEEPTFQMEGQIEVGDFAIWSPLAVSAFADFPKPCSLFIEAKINGDDWILLRESRISEGSFPTPLPMTAASENPA